MSDNIIVNGTTTPGGATVRTDDISGVHFPVSKIAIGIDGADDGLVGDTNPLPVAVKSFPSGAATETTLAGVLAALLDTLAVSVAALPLPAGAATQATLAQVLSALAGTLSVSAASLPLPAGASTEATLAAISAKLATLGQKAMAGSVPVALASDQSPVPVSAGSLPLPSGAASESTLAGVLKTSDFQARVPPLGQAAKSKSVPVTIANDQGAFAVVGPAGIPAHDYVAHSYSGDLLQTTTYKTGGADGTTVATLTYGYTGDVLTSVTRT